MKKTTGKPQSSSLPLAVVMGLLAGGICMMLTAMAATYLIWNETVAQASMGYLSGLTVLLGAIAASAVAVSRRRENWMLVCLLSGACFLLLLTFCNLVLLDGRIVGFWPQCALIMGSTCAVGILKGRDVQAKKGGKKYR